MTPLPIPKHPNEIDAAWLEDALRPRHPRVRIGHVRLLEHHEATNSHAELEVTYEEADGAAERLFCKLLPSESLRRSAIVATGMGLREALFYERLAPALSMRMPRVYAVRSTDEGAFVLLLEDLHETGCTISDGPTSVSVDAAAGALEDLAEMHRTFRDEHGRRAAAAWITGPAPASDYGSSRLQYGLDHHRDKLSDAFAEIATLYIEKQAELHALWNTEPTTVVHGDTHIGNLFDDRGRTGFLDWGLIHLNGPLRDVSYFLTMALSVEDRRAQERTLLQHYLEAWNAGSDDQAIDFEDAWKQHRLLTSYLAPASCQIVTFPETDSPARRAFGQAFLDRAQAAIADLEVREALARFAGI